MQQGLATVLFEHAVQRTCVGDGDVAGTGDRQAHIAQAELFGQGGLVVAAIFIGLAQINDRGDAIGGGIAQLLFARLASGDEVRAWLAQRRIASEGVGGEQQ